MHKVQHTPETSFHLALALNIQGMEMSLAKTVVNKTWPPLTVKCDLM